MAGTESPQMRDLREHALRLCRGDKYAADDLLQDTCIKIFKREPGLLDYLLGIRADWPPEFPNPEGYAYRTLLNEYLDHKDRRTVVVEKVIQPRYGDTFSPVADAASPGKASPLDAVASGSRGGRQPLLGSGVTFAELGSATRRVVRSLEASKRAGPWQRPEVAVPFGHIPLATISTAASVPAPVWCPKHLLRPDGCPYLDFVTRAVEAMVLNWGQPPPTAASRLGIEWVRAQVTAEVETKTGMRLHGTKVSRDVAPCATWVLFLVAHDLLIEQRVSGWIDPTRVAPRMHDKEFKISSAGRAYLEAAFPRYFASVRNEP